MTEFLVSTEGKHGWWKGSFHFTHQTGAETGEGASEMSPLHYVFVYGTLRQGLWNHAAFLSQSHFLGEATTKDKFVMFGNGFPLARPPVEDDAPLMAGLVRGELYGVTDKVLADLDRLEGHPHFYKRTITPIVGHKTKEVWMYHWANKNAVIDMEAVPPDPTTGVIDWKKHVSKLWS